MPDLRSPVSNQSSHTALADKISLLFKMLQVCGLAVRTPELSSIPRQRLLNVPSLHRSLLNVFGINMVPGPGYNWPLLYQIKSRIDKIWTNKRGSAWR